MTTRNDLVRAIHDAHGGPALAQAVAALDSFEKTAASRAARDREVDLGAQVVARRLTPVPVHELHTAATDWLASYEVPPEDGYRTAMIAEASAWYGGLDPAVREDGEELFAQAQGRAQTLASAYGSKSLPAAREFLQMVGYLSRVQGGSGLPQIDQTIDANNAPAPTPYPTDVFPTFGDEQDDEFNGVETNSHGSGASSEGAPMLEQIQQQNSSGSGFGSGPERPDQHSTGMDTSNSYSELPPGSPGTISTGVPGQGPTVISQPNPVAGTNQDAGADRRHAAVAGYSYPDAFGYRWVMSPEIMHPFHERCASSHWPDEGCGGMSHTGSVAIGYQMDLDRARRLAQAERVGVGEGLRAFHGSRTLADLTVAHNRFATAWGESGRSAEDTAVLHGFMAVVRPVMAEMMPTYRGDPGIQAQAAGGLAAGGVSESERENAAHHLPGTDKFPVDSAADVRNAKHDIGRTSEPHSKVVNYINEMAEEYHVAPVGGGKNHRKAAALGGRLDFPEAATAALSKGAPFAGYNDFEDCTEENSDKDDPSAYCGEIKHKTEDKKTAASGLTQVQQITSPDNAATPQDDDLPEGVAFPLNESWQQQWMTGPQGAQPKGATPQAEAAGMRGLPEQAAQMFGHLDALDGKMPQHKDHYPFTSRAHGTYLRGWNGTHAAITARDGSDPMTRDGYGNLTGRPDLYPHWKDAYDQASRRFSTDRTDSPAKSAARRVRANGSPMGDTRPAEDLSGGQEVGDQDGDQWGGKQASSGSGVHPDTDRCPDCGHLYSDEAGCSTCYAGRDEHHASRTVQADTWSQPRQSTDDLQVPYSQPSTNAPMRPGGGDYEAGAAAGRADRAAGERPAFADNSSRVSPYVKGYAEAYGAAREPQGAQDVPYSMGGDSGQGLNAGQAQRSFEVAHASRVSAAFVPPELYADPDFAKGYRFASKWQPGQRLVSTGSAAFEAGLYAGVTDRPEIQIPWMAMHGELSRRPSNPALASRIALHASFTAKTAGKSGLCAQGAYLVRQGAEEAEPTVRELQEAQMKGLLEPHERLSEITSERAREVARKLRSQRTAGTSTDLITDGPGTSPDPMGATPLNGPGTPPPMGGRDEAATPGGAPPYQGAPPLPGGPVVPDDVMGRPQQQPQPSGPFTNTFSGQHPGNATLAPVAPNSADRPGYTNADAYRGDPHGGDRLAVFRRRVQAGLAQMREAAQA